jgi:hypothetical protein
MPLQGTEARQAVRVSIALQRFHSSSLQPHADAQSSSLQREHTWLPNQGRAAASYHIGVIDILQQWNRKKQMERTAKALLGKDIEGLSAIDADSFQSRFMRAMESHFPALDLDATEGEEEEDVDLFETTTARTSGGASPGLRVSGGAGGGGSRLRLSSGTLGGSARMLVSPTSSNETA